jgi:prophage regulatory protein
VLRVPVCVPFPKKTTSLKNFYSHFADFFTLKGVRGSLGTRMINQSGAQETKMSKLLNFEEFKAKIGSICRTTIWKLEKDGLFPKRRALTDKIVRWDESEIDAWIQSRDKNAGFMPDIRRKQKGCPPK